MKQDRLAHCIGGINDNYIDEAEAFQKNQRRPLRIWSKIAACAACLALLAVLPFTPLRSLISPGREQPNPPTDTLLNPSSSAGNSSEPASESNSKDDNLDTVDPPAGNNNEVNSGSTFDQNNLGGTLYVPAIELPEDFNPSSYAMRGLIVYNGHIYSQAQVYYDTDAEAIEDLVGDYLGHATDSIDEWSTREDYDTEFASTNTGDVYSVKGYDIGFRLCLVEKHTNESGGTVKEILFFERLNDIELSTGKDLFGDRLHIKDNWASARCQTYESWSDDSYGIDFRELSGVTDQQINDFIEELYNAPFEYTYDTLADDPDFYQSYRYQPPLYLTMKDGTQVMLQLFEGGYVGYYHLNWYYVKMPGETFDAIFAAYQ